MAYLHDPPGPRRATWMTPVAEQRRSVTGLEHVARVGQVAALVLPQQPGGPDDYPGPLSC